MIDYTPKTLRECLGKFGRPVRQADLDAFADAWKACEKASDEYARLWHRDAKRLEAAKKAVKDLRPLYGGVCRVCGNVVSQEGNEIGLDYIEGHSEDCSIAALAAGEQSNG